MFKLSLLEKRCFHWVYACERKTSPLLSANLIAFPPIISSLKKLNLIKSVFTPNAKEFFAFILCVAFKIAEYFSFKKLASCLWNVFLSDVNIAIESAVKAWSEILAPKVNLANVFAPKFCW